VPILLDEVDEAIRDNSAGVNDLPAKLIKRDIDAIARALCMRF